MHIKSEDGRARVLDLDFRPDSCSFDYLVHLLHQGVTIFKFVVCI